MFFIARNISSTETQQYCSLLINFPLERWRKDVLVSYLTSLWENIHNVHKAHGHDHISIRMIKICDKSILKPLTILFENSMKPSYYPDIWKKSNIMFIKKITEN